jgi:hypothetical protein
VNAKLSGASQWACLAICTMILTLAPGAASAQGDDPNPGAVTLTTGIDFPSVYFFRGIRQEAEPKFTMFPYGDVGITLFSGDGGVKSAGVNFGVWNSLNTGTSGSGDDGPGPMHYEEDFYASLSLGFGGGITLTPMFTAYTSPNGLFRTVKELSFKVAHASRFAPYGLVAFELGGDDSGQADGGYLLASGGNRGTYAELGVAPSWSLAEGKATVAIPVKIGLSLSDYYEHPETGEDETFGYIDGGVLFTIPFSTSPTKFGSWNLHGGVDFFGFGDTTKAFNKGDGGQVIGSIGIGMSY